MGLLGFGNRDNVTGYTLYALKDNGGTHVSTLAKKWVSKCRPSKSYPETGLVNGLYHQ